MERGTIMGSVVSLLTVAALLVSATADLVSGRDLGRPGNPQCINKYGDYLYQLTVDEINMLCLLMQHVQVEGEEQEEVAKGTKPKRRISTATTRILDKKEASHYIHVDND